MKYSVSESVAPRIQYRGRAWLSYTTPYRLYNSVERHVDRCKNVKYVLGMQRKGYHWHEAGDEEVSPASGP